MGNTITLTESDLTIEPQGLDKVWSLTGSIRVPWSHVRGATYDTGMKNEPKGWRGPGLGLGAFGKLSGTFHRDGERQFWNISGWEDTVVIELLDEHFSRLVLSVDDPVGTVASINAKAAAS